MGTGIMGVIPLSFCFDGDLWIQKRGSKEQKDEFMKYAPKDFFKFYNKEERTEKENKKLVKVDYYFIKPEILLPNFKDFFFEFHNLIGESSCMNDDEKFDDEYNAIVASNDFDKFIAHFMEEGGRAPSIFNGCEPMYITDCKNLLIYRGSYKAVLEEWSTLMHMERLLRAAVKNPLAKVVRFGMSM